MEWNGKLRSARHVSIAMFHFDPLSKRFFSPTFSWSIECREESNRKTSLQITVKYPHLVLARPRVPQKCAHRSRGQTCPLVFFSLDERRTGTNAIFPSLSSPNTARMHLSVQPAPLFLSLRDDRGRGRGLMQEKRTAFSLFSLNQLSRSKGFATFPYAL